MLTRVDSPSSECGDVSSRVFVSSWGDTVDKPCVTLPFSGPDNSDVAPPPLRLLRPHWRTASESMFWIERGLVPLSFILPITSRVPNSRTSALVLVLPNQVFLTYRPLSQATSLDSTVPELCAAMSTSWI